MSATCLTATLQLATRLLSDARLHGLMHQLSAVPTLEEGDDYW